MWPATAVKSCRAEDAMQVQKGGVILERATPLEAHYLELLVEFAVLVGVGLRVPVPQTHPADCSGCAEVRELHLL